MGRRIVATKHEAEGAGGTIDGYFDRVLKYIPADVVATWTAVSGIISQNASSSNQPGAPTTDYTIWWVAFIIWVILTALWTWKQTYQPGRPPAITQIAVSTTSFIVWVFALGGPFMSWSAYKPLYGSVLLIAFTLGAGLVIPPEEK